jgi:hypothetical protein
MRSKIAFLGAYISCAFCPFLCVQIDSFCRETKPYDPPEDVQTVIEGVCREVIPNEVRSQKWFEVSLKDPNVKFKVFVDSF